MKNRYFFIILILTLCFISFESYSAKKKALFLGNSFTAGMPQIVADIAISAGDTLVVGFNWGGQTLAEHAQNPMTYDMIRSDDWDYVVLQQQSQISISDANTFQFYSYDPANIIKDSVKKIHPCAQMVTYMTWGYQSGPLYQPPSNTYLEQQQNSRNNYIALADELEGFCSPVGMAWRHVRLNDYNVVLYDADQYHPSQTGMYLTALVFYTSFFGNSPVGLYQPGYVTDSTATLFQETAEMIVLDSLNMWRNGTYAPNFPPVGLTPKKNSVSKVHEIQFTWELNPNADSYDLQVSDEENFSNLLVNEEGITSMSYQETFPDEGQILYYRLRSRYDYDGSECITVWGDPINFTTPFDLPEVISPLHNSNSHPVEGTMSWTKPNDGHVFRVQLSDNDDMSDLILDEDDIQETTYDYSGLEPQKDYYWRVAVRYYDVYYAWTDVQKFRTAPIAPKPLTPENNSVDLGLTVDFTWERVAENVTDEFSISDTEDFSNTLVQVPNLLESKLRVPLLEQNNRYYWRVRSSESNDSSAWSEVFTFTTEKTDLEVPVLISPENNSVKIPVDVNLLWDGLEETEFYEFEVATDNGFKNIINTQTNLNDVTYNVTGLENYVTYYWRVRSGKDDKRSAWSEVWNFRTISPELTSAPIIISPENKEEDVNLNANFKWNELDYALEYDIEISTSETFEPNDEVLSSPTHNNYLMVEPLEEDKWHFWRIRGSNEAGKGPWTDTHTFKTKLVSSVDWLLGDSHSLKVYPNPTTGEFWIEGDFNDQELEYTFFDLLGNEILSGNVNTSNGIVNFKFDNSFNSGVYLVLLSNGKDSYHALVIVE